MTQVEYSGTILIPVIFRLGPPNNYKIGVIYKFLVFWQVKFGKILEPQDMYCIAISKLYAHDAMGCRIDPTQWTHWAISCSSQYWYNKGSGMCYPVYRILHIKEPLLLIGTSSLNSGPLPYVQCHMTINKSVLLNKTFHSFIPLSLPEWSFTYVWHHIKINKNVLSVLLIKHFLTSCMGAGCISVVALVSADGVVDHCNNSIW